MVGDTAGFRAKVEKSSLFVNFSAKKSTKLIFLRLKLARERPSFNEKTWRRVFSKNGKFSFLVGDTAGFSAKFEKKITFS